VKEDYIMPTLDAAQVNANLDLLLQLQLANLSTNPFDTSVLIGNIDKVREEYREAAEKGKTSKYHKDLADSMVKSLPLIVKGTYAATEAFKKGDHVTGSAAIMDICASVIPVFTNLFSAGGPPGALVGALFSVIGQILSFFAPKQPSLEEKIQKMLDRLKSEEHIEEMTGVGYSISSYATSLRTRCMGSQKMETPVALAGSVSLTADSKAVTGKGTTFTQTAEVGQWLLFESDPTQKPYKIDSIADDTSLTLASPYSGASKESVTVKYLRRTIVRRSIDQILAMPLTTDVEADAFLVELEGLQWGLGRGQGKLDAPVFANWKVAGYLERERNWAKEGWPEVLGVWCRTYTDLLTANMMLSCLADPKTIDRLLDETRATDEQRITKGSKKDCHRALIKLKALVRELPASWKSDKEQMLEIVQKVRAPARERGMYAHLGYFNNGNVLYIAAGNGSSDALKWDYKQNTAWLTSISIHVPKAQIDSFVPKYEVLTCEYDNRIGRHTLDSVTGTLSDRTQVIEPGKNGVIEPGKGPGGEFLDVCGIAMNDGTPGVDYATQPKTLVTVAMKKETNRWASYSTIDKNNKSTWLYNSSPGLGVVSDTRCLYPATSGLPGDPGANPVSDLKAPVVYLGNRNDNFLHVLVNGSLHAQVLGPEEWGNYNGIEVDPYYLWVFGKGGIACATHASIMKCSRDKTERPDWIYHDFDTSLWKSDNAPEVISLYPCADGTLVASMLSNIYTADYEIDRKSERIVTTSWVKRGGNAKQVIRMPIACWPVLESLKARLQSESD
jgi:hypothetical protein